MPSPSVDRPIPVRPLGRSVFATGTIAGVIAGALMILWSMSVAGVNGLGFWLPPKLIAGTFLGVNVIVYGAGTVIFGLFLHLLTAALWGMLFAALFRAGGVTFDLPIGVLYGVAVWAFMRYLILPWLDSTMSVRVAVVWWTFFLAHLFYGFVLGLIVPAMRRGDAGAEERAPTHA